MADDRTKPEPAEKTAAPPAPTGGGFIKTWLPLIIVVALMPALAFGMTRFILLPQLQKGLGIIQPAAVNATAEAKPKAKKDGADAKRESVMLNKLLVNVAGTMGARYLLVSLSVVGTGADFKGAMQEHDAQLRDMASGTLANKTLADLEKPGARNLIRTELINGFNNVLGDAVVQEIYLTEFAIQ
jgi:flagellar FliL protein